MKALIISMLSCLGILFFVNGMAADILYDDFSQTHLDKDRWWPREYVREVIDGKLVIKLGNSSGMGAEMFPGMFLNELPIRNPEEITAIEVTTTLIEARVDSSPGTGSLARIAGYFYNINETGGATGDILAIVSMGDRGSGLEAFWQVFETTTDDSDAWTTIATGSLIIPGGLEYGVPYKLKLSYSQLESGEGQFIFEASDQIDTYTGPMVKRDPVKAFKGLSQLILAENSQNDGFIHVEFDDVIVNNSTQIYDDFSAPLDLGKWKNLEWIRRQDLDLGGLKVGNQRSDSSGSARTYITANPDTSYIEAKARVSSDSVFSPGGWGVARLRGTFYNAERGPGSGLEYNGFQGDVIFFLNLQMDSDNEMQARVWVNQMLDENGSTYTRVYEAEFPNAIYPDTDYFLSARFENNQLIFKCDDQTLINEIDTPKYHPYQANPRILATKLFLESGESGYIKAFFDDVRVSDKDIIFCLQDYDFDTDMDGNDLLSFISDSKGVTLEDFCFHFGRTDCP